MTRASLQPGFFSPAASGSFPLAWPDRPVFRYPHETSDDRQRMYGDSPITLDQRSSSNYSDMEGEGVADKMGRTKTEERTGRERKEYANAHRVQNIYLSSG